MEYKKSNLGVFTTLLKVDSISKPIDITNILKRNKTEKQKEQLLKIYTIVGSSCLAFLLVLFISL